MKLAPLAYRADFIAFPLIVVASVAWSVPVGAGWLAQAFAGLFAFYFAEYWVHRLVLHGFYWHANHERHHLHPEEYVVFPWWFIPGIFTTAFAVMPLPFFTGFVVGYIHFTGWHHVLHHADLKRWPRIAAYAQWHLVHHQGVPANYGITSPLFDLVFRTYRKARP